MYAQRQDMEDVFGLKEVITLTDRNRQGEIDDVVLRKALARASSEIDSYIGSRYTLPLSADIIPEALVDRCCDITRFKLCGTSGVQLTEEIRARYEDAVRYLEQIASGKIKLGTGEIGTAKTTNTVKFASGGRQFGRDKTNGGAF
ncbi:DUF1320 domain-containing protein [Limnobaculum zhutongyuii]|uniref:DUF1320 domain-containing protein n=1 Tax=Limnobaculum zhutongyuii TaxID=2498113 RepID=A0A411WHK4_9GAMM|nr:phage protein Gp36 family protein [Limnobaculum zhutongyuii]QBH95467.1 DUF1320 domain-containing protein [Limnobaculum zhutongyuii]TQS88844.1 DUF1320 domain-containing protein [Limnobaculum zhutongyuii]